MNFRAKCYLVAFTLVFCVGFVLVGTPSFSAEEMHIKFSTWHPPESKEVKTVWEPMLDELEEKSDGRITYTMHAGGALGEGSDHYDIVKNGLSDMGYFTATWTPGRFLLSDVLSLAAEVDGKDVGTEIGNAMYEEILHQEFSDVKMIELNGCIQAFLWTTEPVRTLEDCEGLRIRSPGGHQTSYIEALGAEPVFMPLSDVYMAMETGTIDGLVTCPPLVQAFKLYEVAEQGTLATFGCVTEGVIMNQKSWEQTPDDLKPLIEEVAGNPFATTGGLNSDVYAGMMEDIEAEGVELYELPADEAQKWYSLFQEETKEWVADLEDEGLPAKEAVIAYDRECEKRDVNCVACPPEWRD
ncbi:MAG: TRAP transporter substrate-binding protein [Desulfovermiculus sp.]